MALLRLRVVEDGLYSFLDVDEGEVERLKTSFKETDKAVVVAAIGYSGCGKAELLSKFVSPATFQSSESEEIDLSVFPTPVPLEGAPLLLMKLKGFRELNDQYLKMLYVTLRVVDCVLVCLDSNLSANLRTILAIVEEANAVRATPLSKMFVMLIPARHKRGIAAKALQELEQLPQAGIIEFIERSDEMTSQEFAALRSKLVPLVHTQTGHPISEFTEMLHVLQEQFPFSSTYQDFRGYDPSLQRLARERDIFRRVTAERLLILDPREELCRNDAAFQALLENGQFNPDTPTVFLTVFGHPGLGKSTLLNYIYMELLRGSKALDKFKTGNTATHTTRQSEFLPLAVRLTSNLQILVVDLEGLQGTELLNNKRREEVQRQLTSALIAFASVPCIIIKNEVSIFNFIEEKFEIISSHQREFKFAVEKIILLFHDKADNASENRHIVEKVEELKTKYGLEKANAEIMNKPNFASSSKDEIKPFIRKLLSRCEHPKRDLEGRPLSLVEIAGQLKDIVDSVKDYTDVILSPEEDKIAGDVVSRWTREIQTRKESLQTREDNLHDLWLGIITEVWERVKEEVKGQRVGVRKVIEGTIGKAVEATQTEILRIENLFRQLNSSQSAAKSDTSQMEVNMKSFQSLHKHYLNYHAHVKETSEKSSATSWYFAIAASVAAGAFAAKYNWSVLSSAWKQIRAIDKRIWVKISGFFVAGVVVSSALRASAALPPIYSNHPLLSTQKRYQSAIRSFVPMLTTATLSLLMKDKASVRWFVATGLGLFAACYLHYKLSLSMQAKIRAHAEVFHMPKTVLPFYKRIAREQAPVVLVLGENSRTQKDLVTNLLLWCYPYSLQSVPVTLVDGPNLLPVGYLDKSIRLSSGYVLSVNCLPGGFLLGNTANVKLVKAILPFVSTLILLFDNRDLVPESMKLLLAAAIAAEPSEAYICVSGRDYPPPLLDDQLRGQGYHVEVLNLTNGTREFAREIYQSKLSGMRKTDTRLLRAAFQSP